VILPESALSVVLITFNGIPSVAMRSLDRYNATMSSGVRRFFVADLNAKGEVLSETEYRYEQLEQIPGASELIIHLSTVLWRSPDELETLPRSDRQHVKMRWRCCGKGAGILVIWVHDQLASFSLLASGLDKDADALTFGAYQSKLLQELRDTGYEPAFDLMHLEHRPLIATINFHSPPEPVDQMWVALMDRCFAAAYFRQCGLA
jgi:hypothetical protein